MLTSCRICIACALAALAFLMYSPGPLLAVDYPKPLETVSYKLPIQGKVDASALMNTSYLVHLYGYGVAGTYNPEGPLTPVAFTNGVGAEQDANIEIVALNKDAQNPLVAAIYFEAFDGGNAPYGSLCFILQSKQGVVAYQHDIIGSRGISVENMTLKKDTVEISFLYAGYSDPTCCPTARGRAYYKLQNGRIYQIKIEGEGLGRLLF